MKCHLCKHEGKKVATVNDLKICAPCFFEYYCQFCDPPVLNTLCKGHEVTQVKINRFATDKEFTDNIRFEFESGNDVPTQ
jgi:hypothetical protein